MNYPAGTCFVYIIVNEPGLVKVGISQNVRSRFATLQTASPYKLNLIHCFAFPDKKEARDFEECFHDYFAKHQTRGEWFNLNPIKVLMFLCVGIEAFLEKGIENLDERSDMLEKCGVKAARDKLQLWLAPRGTPQ